MRRLLHRYIEAVVGLAENMAGLRFSYAHKRVRPWLGEKIIDNSIYFNLGKHEKDFIPPIRGSAANSSQCL